MKHNRKLNVLLLSCVIALFCYTPSVSAAKWWEEKQESSATDKISITNDKVGENQVIKSASRENWEHGYIEVMAGATADMTETINLGHSYSVATKTARHLAYEKLAETVAGINLYADATYDRELMVDSNLRTVLRTMVRNARVIKEEKKQFSDGSIWVEVTLGMLMFSENGLINPALDWYNRKQVKITPAQEPTAISNLQKPLPVIADNTRYTGLVIDASGGGANPASMPKIIANDGSVIYGGGDIDPQYILKYGLIGYPKTLEKASTSERVGNNPLIVKAVGLKGKNKTDFILSPEDSVRVLSALKANDFFKECRVVAVIN